MEHDPLKSFRQRVRPDQPLNPSSQVVTHQGRPVYEAFRAKDKVLRLDIRCADGLAHAVPYNYLLNISYNWKDYSEIFLTVSGLTVMVKGRGLRPVVDALKMHTCDFIQQYSKSEFGSVADDQPVIESILVDVIDAANNGARRAG